MALFLLGIKRRKRTVPLAEVAQEVVPLTGHPIAAAEGGSYGHTRAAVAIKKPRPVNRTGWMNDSLVGESSV